jgi:hypothetical protein
MAGYPQFNRKDSFLAALGYVPFFFINYLVPAYVLARKGGKYARFHAIHSLALNALGLVPLAIVLIVLYLFWPFISSGSFLNPNFINSSGIMPALVLLQINIFNLYFAFCALKGKPISVPVVTRLVIEKFK